MEQAQGNASSTPGAEWRAKGLPDPHGNRYDCERAALAMGTLTDDELANGVFLHGDGTHGRAPIEEVVAGRAFWPIAWLTAAKDRIRWLSRSLERERATKAELLEAVQDLLNEFAFENDSALAKTNGMHAVPIVRRARAALAKAQGAAS